MRLGQTMPCRLSLPEPSTPSLPPLALFCWERKGKIYVKTQGRPVQRMKARCEEWMFVCICRVSEIGTDALMRRILDSLGLGHA